MPHKRKFPSSETRLRLGGGSVESVRRTGLAHRLEKVPRNFDLHGCRRLKFNKPSRRHAPVLTINVGVEPCNKSLALAPGKRCFWK
jgi:hypothetical protein